MDNPNTHHPHPFLQGGGEMGQLTRNFDWEHHALGQPSVWPQSLRTTVGIILNSKFPMFLFWGSELVCFYNDAYRPSLGNDGKHPSALGKPGADVWPEIWEFIKPMIDQVLREEVAVWHEDQLLPIYRNGKIEAVYWTFSYSLVRAEDGAPAGVFVTCSETTEMVRNLQLLTEGKDQLQFAIDAAELGTWDLNPSTNKFVANARLKEWFGLQPEEEVDLALAIAVIAPQDREQVTAAINAAMQFGNGGTYDIEYTIINPLTAVKRIVRAKGRASFNEANIAYRLNGTLQDVTKERAALNELKDTQRLADIALQSAGIGLFQFGIDDQEARYSPLFARIMTGDPNITQATHDHFIAHIHPDDRKLRNAAVRSGIEHGHFSFEPRVVWQDGTVHRIHVQGGTLYDTDHHPRMLTGTVRDITAFEAQAQSLLESEERMRLLLEKTPVATALFVGESLIIEMANDVMINYWQKDRNVIGLPYGDAMPNAKEQEYFKILRSTFETGKDHQIHAAKVEIVKDGLATTHYYNFSFTPLLNGEGSVYAVLSMGSEVTESIVAQQRNEEVQRELIASFEDSPVGIAILSRDELTFRMANTFYAAFVGRTPEALIGKPMLEALPELQGQGFEALLYQVLDTGLPQIFKEVKIDFLRGENMETSFIDFTYQPRREANGVITGVLVVVVDVTEQVLARHKVEESEGKLKGLIAAAPAGIGLFVGRDLVIEYPNQTFIDIVGKGPGIEGLPLRAAMPELVTEGQPFLQILDDVFTTGKMFQSYGSLVKIVQNGVLTANYYNITYTPVYNARGEIYAILDIAIDVTEQIKAQQQLEVAESELRRAVELAGLATWSLNIKTKTFHFSPRFLDWLGLQDPEQTAAATYNTIPEGYLAKVQADLEAAILPGSNGVYDNEHPVVNQVSGVVRVIHAQAQVFYDADGTPDVLSGTAQDITLQRQIQLKLESEVQLRTEELAAAIEELQTTNEELAATNEELEEANKQLVHSNDELAQYAYVASHDLQEPLRKIRIFSGILTNNSQLNADGQVVLGKISQAAERMGMLIQDLLEFSRLLKTESMMRPVDLSEIIRSVSNDFELILQEKQGTILIGNLPVIEAVGLQMNQLFYNLVSNALKFTAPQKTPIVRIEAEKMKAQDVLQYIAKPIFNAVYYHLTFADNGIGFSTEYAEQIFEVFKRLHGREHYPGSGIGLALCRRIIANHNGILFAESSLGLGSTFHLILPDRQQDFVSDLPPHFQWSNE